MRTVLFAITLVAIFVGGTFGVLLLPACDDVGGADGSVVNDAGDLGAVDAGND